MKERIRKYDSGFSLAETLMAVLILLLVASVVAAGIPAAVNAYTKAVDAANAQTLLSTTVNALRSELSTAWGVEISPPGHTDEIYYYSSRTGSKTRLYIDSTRNTIVIQDYIKYNSYTETQAGATPHDLVPDVMRKKTKDSNEKFSIVFTIPSISSDIVSFASLEVKDGSRDVAKLEPFSVRLLGTSLNP